MNVEEYADLIQIEGEELAESLPGMSYFDLSPQLQIWIRARVCDSLSPEYMQEESVQAASPSEEALMRKRTSQEVVYSKPTMCLSCHLVVEMVHEADADPVKGVWRCPQCGHEYPFAHWKIRQQTPGRPKAA